MISLLPCENTKKDAKQAFQWRNDKETIRSAYIALEKSWDSFFEEYQDYYFRVPDLSPYFILKNDKKVGFVRFEEVFLEDLHQKRSVEIMINIDPNFRRQEVATKGLFEVKKLMKNKGIYLLMADIRMENIASIRLFEKVGFKFFSKRKEFIEITQEKCNILCYRCIL